VYCLQTTKLRSGNMNWGRVIVGVTLVASAFLVVHHMRSDIIGASKFIYTHTGNKVSSDMPGNQFNCQFRLL